MMGAANAAPVAAAVVAAVVAAAAAVVALGGRLPRGSVYRGGGRLSRPDLVLQNKQSS